ncbi:MAG: hypothetical protein VYE73_01135 [Acidobacteriota bacterium]|nr:hypothetical protein [Acidobacteriota bacterium]
MRSTISGFSWTIFEKVAVLTLRQVGLYRPDCRATREIFEQRHLAEDLAVAENDHSARLATDLLHHLDLAGLDDEQLVARTPSARISVPLSQVTTESLPPSSFFAVVRKTVSAIRAP